MPIENEPITDCDLVESIRMQKAKEVNAVPSEREKLEALYGRVWNTVEMKVDFEPISFAAPYIFVKRRSDGSEGTLTFQHNPRFYFKFQKY